MLNLAVSGTVHCRAPVVLAVLDDAARFHEWWPAYLHVAHHDGDGVTIRPLPFVRIGLARRPDAPEGRIAYEYAHGPFRGVGVWSAKTITDHPPLTEVSYEILLRPVNVLVALASSTFLFRNRHTNDIQRIIRCLDAYCGAKPSAAHE